ncbi:alpha-N-acetylglucosaminidase [Flectobacillus major]|uniref:alpha-N-acetylglucosaminidase n=1 Tax=Flectobacillus major TaxID=103 RepID=UPI000411783A|nr:alpha-N-acetylglucosaminidase [Flectobacillus major]
MMKKKIKLLIVMLLLSGSAMAQVDLAASKALIKRVLPKYAMAFEVASIPQENGKDVFEIENKGHKIVLRGSSGVSIASALNFYLNEYCHCQITWNGTNLNLPANLPKVQGKVHKNTSFEYRYYLNYCTFNYSMSWWDWARWEQEIDWMALHGINMPLAITGEEYTWYEVYKEMGFSDQDLASFFSGPAYFSWFWMGNLDAWGGPLPFSWMKSHKELQTKILARERALGMIPVLPAFTGHVPSAFKKKYPQAKLKATNWTNGFADTYILDSEDPLFAEIGKRFLQKQTALFGTNHFYSADTFNENEPPTDDPAFLSKLSARVYEGMKQADPQAVWVMQGWLFYSDRKFWKEPQIKALLDAVPNDKMLLLDLASEIEPVWKRTQAYYGKPWVWNMLHNFGGNVNLFGRIEGVANGPIDALDNPNKGNLKGIGLTMEAIEQNPVLYELTMRHVWESQPLDLDKWLDGYILNRYTKLTPKTQEVWQILKKTAYNGKEIRDGAESILTGRPTFDSAAKWTRTKLNYPPKELLPAWKLMVESTADCGKSDGFQYDLVDIARQVLANYALPLQKKWVVAYKNKDQAAFEKYSQEYLVLMDDLDQLLATRKDFLLGKWIADARRNGTTPAEKALYEQNARDLITLWGDENSPLHEYSNRQWSGLMSDFYKPRWQQFFAKVKTALTKGEEVNTEAFEKEISRWEWQWVTTQKSFPTQPTGNANLVAKALYDKYYQKIAAAYSK